MIERADAVDASSRDRQQLASTHVLMVSELFAGDLDRLGQGIAGTVARRWWLADDKHDQDLMRRQLESFVASLPRASDAR
jgi:hypothetical protein